MTPENQKQLLENWEREAQYYSHATVSVSMVKLLLEAQDAKTREECAGIVGKEIDIYLCCTSRCVHKSETEDKAKPFLDLKRQIIQGLEEAKQKILLNNQERDEQ